MKWGIFLVLLACCLYFTTARPNDIDPDDSKEKSQPEIAKNSTNGELDDGNSQSEYKFVIGNDLDDEHATHDVRDRMDKKPLHELAELLYSDYNVSKSTMIESLEQFQNLFEITMLNKSTEMYKTICDFVNNTQLHDNESMRYEIDEIFESYRHEEVNRYKPYEQNFNRQLLFHGTPTRNVVGILKNGLKIAPSEAKSTGSTFGRGIYFSDSVSESASYCRANRVGIVLLCEVALGVVDIRYKHDKSQLKDHCESGQALGDYYPHPIYTQPDGLKIPNGMLFRRNETTGMPFNVFVVSNEARVKIRYLVKLKFNY